MILFFIILITIILCFGLVVFIMIFTIKTTNLKDLDIIIIYNSKYHKDYCWFAFSDISLIENYTFNELNDKIGFGNSPNEAYNNLKNKI